MANPVLQIGKSSDDFFGEPIAQIWDVGNGSIGEIIALVLNLKEILCPICLVFRLRRTNILGWSWQLLSDARED